MIDHGVEIGAHTRTHCDLGAIFDPVRLHDEVVGARDDLQAELGIRIRYFAYPYGMRPNLSREVFQLAHDADYEAACSAYGGLNFPGDDAFHIQRLHGDLSMARFKNNLTFDPRKLHIERYPYLSPEKTPEPDYS
jgi:peptidoglycan/xylan/chitin deacetylase (PgdA/CDA1 family)